MFRKRNIFIFVGILLVICAIWWFGRGEKEEELRTDTVRRGTVVETVSVTGKLVPVHYADLSFSTVGEVEALHVKEGESVNAGQAIASLDGSVLLAELREARLALSQAEENERLARREWESLKPEEKNAQKLTTQQAREAVKAAEAQVAKTRLTAPMAGTLSYLNIREGEVVTAGQVLARVVGSPHFLLEARVPESDIAKVRVGMIAIVDFDSLESGKLLKAEVTDIDRAPTVVQDVVSYIVTLKLQEAEPRLKEGMTADIDIETARSEDVLLVPFRVLTRENGKTYAERLEADGSRERVEVTVGVEGDDGTTEIRSGLKEGDQVTIGIPQTN